MSYYTYIERERKRGRERGRDRACTLRIIIHCGNKALFESHKGAMPQFVLIFLICNTNLNS